MPISGSRVLQQTGAECCDGPDRRNYPQRIKDAIRNQLTGWWEKQLV
jgi:hypothetical protein